MSQLEASCIFWTTAILLILMGGMPLFYRKFPQLFPPSQQQNVEVFRPREILIAIFLTLFYAFPALSVVPSPEPYTPQSSSTSIVNLIILQSPHLIAALVALNCLNQPYHRTLTGWSTGQWKSIILAAVLVLGLMIVFLSAYDSFGIAEFIAQWFQAPLTQRSITSLMSGSWELKIFIACSSVLVAPFAEELVCRGLLYNVLKSHTGKVTAAILVSLFFGIIHAHIVSMLPLALFSLLLIVIYEKSKSLWAPILAHLLFNLYNVTCVFLFPH